MSCAVQDYGPPSRPAPLKGAITKKPPTSNRETGPIKHTIAKARELERATKHNAQQALARTTTQGYATRSRTRTFPFLRVPAELRNRIYALALDKPGTQGLATFTAPALLQTTRQLRSEARGFATQVNDFHVNVRCSWCVVGAHAAGEMHPFYAETGKLMLDGEREEWMEEQGVAFRSLKIGVLCCCCERTRIGDFRLKAEGEQGALQVSFDLHYVRDEARVKGCFEVVLSGMKEVIAKAEARKGFVGLSIQDLKEVAACLRWSEEDVPK